MKYYESDEIWEALYHIKSKEEFIEKIMPDFTLTKDVDPNIAKDYKVIENLVALSYFDYKLVDEAVRKSLLVFEMALKIHYKRIEGVEWKDKRFSKNEKNIYSNGKKTPKRKNLETLINELYNKNVFEVSREFLHHVRTVRNSFAHPENHTFGGVAIFHWLENLVLVINECYEKTSSRSKRKKEIESFNSNI